MPKGIINLWVAGRCDSSDTKVHGSIRAQSAADMMGQAAAAGAVQSIRKGNRNLDTEQLVVTLRANGAYRPQRELSKVMTR
ncbi:MAG TPA: FAD-dependent oxidoreductase [Xanthobacteraceae bacterium]|nr:FAD-dependent oxidoreductase [Xanthobacteraceae bacterium]